MQAFHREGVILIHKEGQQGQGNGKRSAREGCEQRTATGETNKG